MMKQRNELLVKLRKERRWSLHKVSIKSGYSASYLSIIERGKCQGKIEFWQDIQKLFDVPDEDMWALMNGRAINPKNKQ